MSIFRPHVPLAGLSPAFLILVMAAAAAPVQADWTRLSGPVPPPAAAFAEHTGRTFLGTNFGDSGDLFLSEDGGHTWSDVGVPNGGVTTFHAHGGDLYMGSYLSGLFRSTDDGTTWSSVGGLFQGATPTAFVTLDPVTLIVGLDNFFPVTLKITTDGGSTWNDVAGGPSVRCHDLALAGPAILVGSEDQGVLRSTNGGLTWGDASTGLPAFADVFRFAVDGADVYAAVRGSPVPLEVYRSTNSGGSWSQVSADLPTHAGHAAAELFLENGDLYLALSGTSGDRGLFRSTNGGVNWTKLTAGLAGDPNANAAAFLGGELVVGNMDGVHRTTDGGSTWADSWQGSSGVSGHHSILHAFGKLFAGSDQFTTFTDGIVSTPDLGGSWSSPTGLATNTTARALLLHEGNLYAALYSIQRGVAISTDGGESFALTGTWSTSVVLNALHAHDGVLFAGAWDSFFRSTDDGATWASDGQLGTVYDFASLDGWLYAARYPGGVSRSSDAGLTWTSINAGIGATHINALEVFDGSVFAAVNSGSVVRWNGAAWVSSGLAETAYALIVVGGTLLAGTPFSEVWVTTDGSSWQDFSDGFTGGIIEEMGVTPTHVIGGTRGKGLWARPRTELPGATSVVATPAAAAGFRLAVAPNPFRSGTSVSFELPRETSATVTIFDTGGRRVRVFESGVRPAGRHVLTWDGRDGSGRPAAAGIYFVRLDAGPERRSAKVSLLR